MKKTIFTLNVLLLLGVTLSCAKKKKSQETKPSFNMEETVMNYCGSVPDSEFQINDVTTGVDKEKSFGVSFRGEIAKMNNVFDNSAPFSKMYVKDLTPPTMSFSDFVGHFFTFGIGLPRSVVKIYIGVDEFQVRTKFKTTSNSFEVSLLKKQLVYDNNKEVKILDSAGDFPCHENNETREMCHKVLEYKISQLEVALKNPKNKELDKLFNLKVNCANETLKYVQEKVLVPQKDAS